MYHNNKQSRHQTMKLLCMKVIKVQDVSITEASNHKIKKR